MKEFETSKFTISTKWKVDRRLKNETELIIDYKRVKSRRMLA
jgi:hypothetical protein